LHGGQMGNYQLLI